MNKVLKKSAKLNFINKIYIHLFKQKTCKNNSFLDKKKYINRIFFYKSVFWQKSVFR